MLNAKAKVWDVRPLSRADKVLGTECGQDNNPIAMQCVQPRPDEVSDTSTVKV